MHRTLRTTYSIGGNMMSSPVQLMLQPIAAAAFIFATLTIWEATSSVTSSSVGAGSPGEYRKSLVLSQVTRRASPHSSPGRRRLRGSASDRRAIDASERHARGLPYAPTGTPPRGWDGARRGGRRDVERRSVGRDPRPVRARRSGADREPGLEHSAPGLLPGAHPLRVTLVETSRKPSSRFTWPTHGNTADPGRGRRVQLTRRHGPPSSERPGSPAPSARSWR